MDVRHARISADSHFMRYGNSEDRISSPFLYNPESKFGYRISAFLYILFLANELYLKSSIIHFTLKSLISYIQYLQISNKKFELIVTIPWLSGGVREAFNTYNLREYSSRNYLRLEGLKNVFDSSESPMLLIANNNENSKYLIFFPVQVLTLLSRGNLERPFHIHHAFGNISNFLEFIQIPNYKLYFFVHDYYLFSQLPHLYDEEKLNRISLSAAVQDFPNFKINLNEVIDKIDFFIFPSISVRKNLFNLIPISKQITMYPPEYSDIELTRVSRMSLNPSYKILILGHLGNYKGMRIIRNTILESRRQNLKFKFIHIGKPVFDFKCSNYVNLPDLGRSEIEKSIELLNVDFAWLPFQCEETYSFALSDIFLSHLPLISTNLGAISERCLGRDLTLLLEPNLDVFSIVEVFKSFLASSQDVEVVKINNDKNNDLAELNTLRKRDLNYYKQLF